MKAAQMMGVAVLMAASGLVMQMAEAQQPGTKRTDLQRHDLSIPGREVKPNSYLGWVEPDCSAILSPP